MDASFDVISLRKKSEELVDTVTSPDFLRQLKAVIEAAPEQRLSEAATRLSPESLKQLGVKLPEATRISSRYFDDAPGGDVWFADMDAGDRLLQRLNKLSPGILDKIREKDIELLRQLSEFDRRFDEARNAGRFGVDPRVAGACVCVGAGPCVGVGG